MANIQQTPLLQQYKEMKSKHPDAILLFRVGDFYETFSEDAISASEILGITLTRRANGNNNSVELAGFPHHALDTYLPKLVRAGRRVAICEQLEDPKLTKKLVKRGITELVTPNVQETPKPEPQPDYSKEISIISTIIDFFNLSYILNKLFEQTKEFHKLATRLGISPKRTFEAFSESLIVQPSLFD